MSYKRCPSCGGQVLINVPLCGACGFRFPVNAQQAPSIPQHRMCSHCGFTELNADVACHQCGYYFDSPSNSPSMPRLSDPGWEIPVDDAQVNYPSIVAMWLSTAAAIATLLLFGIWAAVIIDVIAVCFAISLVVSKSAANRANGWLKLGLEAIGFITAFVANANAHRY